MLPPAGGFPALSEGSGIPHLTASPRRSLAADPGPDPAERYGLRRPPWPGTSRTLTCEHRRRLGAARLADEVADVSGRVARRGQALDVERPHLQQGGRSLPARRGPPRARSRWTPAPRTSGPRAAEQQRILPGTRAGQSAVFHSLRRAKPSPNRLSCCRFSFLTPTAPPLLLKRSGPQRLNSRPTRCDLPPGQRTRAAPRLRGPGAVHPAPPAPPAELPGTASRWTSHQRVQLPQLARDRASEGTVRPSSTRRVPESGRESGRGRGSGQCPHRTVPSVGALLTCSVDRCVTL